MASPIDQRRLRDAARAEAIGEPDTIEGLEKAIESIGDGIRAIQSLDDLGPEGNREAGEQEMRLFAKEREYKAKLEALRAANT